MAHHQVKASHLIQILEASRGIGGSAVEGLKIGHPRQFKQQRFGAAVKKNPLPCFPLYPEHIGILSTRSNNHELDQCKNRLLQDSVTPTEFHQHLCKSIQNAKRRVKLATLYIGAGNGCMSNQKDKTEIASSKEEELLLSLQHLSNHSTTDDNNDIEIKILMDASRGLRPINIMYQTNNEKDCKSATSNIEEEKIAMTSSAREVYYSLFPNGKKESNNKGISLFNVHSGLWSYMPSPINEIFGVFHLKVYIIDDELILSGANLSEEYFTDRLDRYISFVKGMFVNFLIRIGNFYVPCYNYHVCILSIISLSFHSFSLRR
jgi:CDP-diacylglycerol--glycerol-3-phosphate 3-phosphatidyltransferase